MMEIVFGESAYGSLQIAQSYGKGPYSGSAVGVFLHHRDGKRVTQAEMEAARRKAEEDARREWEAATPLGGSSRDVHCIDLQLSSGDISEDVPGEKRCAELEKYLKITGDDALSASVLKSVERAQLCIAEARRRMEAGEGVRIWYSRHDPNEFCGFCWLMAQLQGIAAGEICAVELPMHEENGERIVSYGSWGEVPLNRWHRLAGLAQAVSPGVRRMYAAQWRQLQAENAPLRAIVNGSLMSVPLDFYDGFIRREIDVQEEKFHEARLIGNIIGKYRLGMGDAFIALRIEDMIRNGELEAVTLVEAGDAIYRRWLRKRNFRLER